MFGDLKLILIVGAAAITMLTATYFYGRASGASDCDARHAEAAQADYMKRVEEGNILSAGLETELAASRNFYLDLERKVASEISSNPLYASCIVPANGVYLVNSAVAGRAAR